MPSPDAPDVEALVHQELTRLMGEFLFDEDDVDLDESLTDLGFDSLSRADLLGKINNTFGTDVPLDVMLACRSLADLGEHLIARYGNRLARSVPGWDGGE